MARYVILTHNHPFLHWDFMLEQGDILRTWRLLREPDPGGEIPAELLGDHRIDYLDYEGPVSGDRGEVRRWDRGEFSVIEETADRMRVHLSGRKLSGTALLQRVGTDVPGKHGRGGPIPSDSGHERSADWTFHFTSERRPSG